MIRKFIKDVVADLTHSVARSELAAENARLASRVKDLERTVNQNVEAGNTLMWERDDARKQRDDLRSKLEVAERRQPVDRSAALQASGNVLAQWGKFIPVELHQEIVDAVLGAAKAEPAKRIRDHAAAVKRVGDLERLVANQRDTIAALNRETAQRAGRNAKLATELKEEKEKLKLFDRVAGERIDERLAKDADQIARLLSELDKTKAEVARLSAPCPADGMSDREVSVNISTALYHNNDGWADHEAGGAAARALFGRVAK